MRRMADSVTAADLPVGYDLYAGYVNGLYANMAQIERRFPNSKVIGISVTIQNNGTVLDVENGDATPFQAPSWVEMRRQAGIVPWVYCSESVWPSVIQAFSAQGIAPPLYWIAAYPGPGPVLYPGSIAHQWADQGLYDESVVADFIPGVDTVAPAQEDDVPYYAVNSNGTGYVIACDLSSKTGIPGPDAPILIATGFYKVMDGLQGRPKLTDALINAIPNA
jgi:hypothetical protein